MYEYANLILFHQKSTIKLQHVANLVSESWMDVFNLYRRLTPPFQEQPIILS